MESYAYIAEGSNELLADWLSDRGYKIRRVSKAGLTVPQLSNHPDMFMCKLGACDSSPVIFYEDGCTEPGREYPYDIPYNAACTGKFFIHNLRYTAPEILRRVRQMDMRLIDVRQGYSKCSVAVIDEASIITYDRGIASACLKEGMKVLVVEPGNVLLKGYNTGFIGGASGRAGDTIVFNGDLSRHPDFREITGFIEKRGLGVKFFREWPLTDTGSIITYEEACDNSDIHTSQGMSS